MTSVLRAVAHGMFTIERKYAASPERVFAAFADPEQKRKWFDESSSREVVSHETDFRVGGHERVSYRMGPETPFPGTALSNDTCYQEILPRRRIVMAYTMSMAGRAFSSSLATVEFREAEGGGTELVFTEQSAFFEGADGTQRRQKGWEELLDRLKRALEQ